MFVDSFDFLDEHPQYKDPVNDVRCDLQQLREDVQMCTNAIVAMRNDFAQLTETLCDRVQQRAEPPAKRERVVPTPTARKKTKSESVDQFNFESVAREHNLSDREMFERSVLAICLGSHFLKCKCLPTNFVACVYFQWLCVLDCDSDKFIEDSCKLLQNLGVMKTSLGTNDLWDKIMNFNFSKSSNRRLGFRLLLNGSVPENESLEIGSVLRQVHIIDFIRCKIAENNDLEIDDWCFTYLCMCVLDAGPQMQDWARLALLSLIRSHRIPESVFDDGVILRKVHERVSRTPDSVGTSVFLNVLFTLHKSRKWVGFFGTYENAVAVLKSIPSLPKNKATRKVAKFRGMAAKIKMSDFYEA
jgi:hypothetical protein